VKIAMQLFSERCFFDVIPDSKFESSPYFQILQVVYSSMADVIESPVVRWNNVNRKATIDSIIETTEDGRYSSMKNKKASWNLAVSTFNAKTGLSYSKKILVSKIQSLKKNWAVYDHYGCVQ
jgi:Myb/SANT-like DNA-binding domain